MFAGCTVAQSARKKLSTTQLPLRRDRSNRRPSSERADRLRCRPAEQRRIGRRTPRRRVRPDQDDEEPGHDDGDRRARSIGAIGRRRPTSRTPTASSASGSSSGRSCGHPGGLGGPSSGTIVGALGDGSRRGADRRRHRVDRRAAVVSRGTLRATCRSPSRRPPIHSHRIIGLMNTRIVASVSPGDAPASSVR